MGAVLEKFLFRPPADGADAEVVAGEGETTAWLSTGNRALMVNAGFDQWVLFSHATSESLATIQKCRLLHWFSRSLKANMFCYEYSGYGVSQTGGVKPTPTEELCNADIEAAWDLLTVELNVAPANIILFGRSLGTGPTVNLAFLLSQGGEADQGGPGGVVLEGAFTSILNVGQDLGLPLFALPRHDVFNNKAKMPQIKFPVMMIHGLRDEVVPHAHCVKLLALLEEQYRAEPYFVDGAGHNNLCVLAGNEYFTNVRAFLASVHPSRSRVSSSAVPSWTEGGETETETEAESEAKALQLQQWLLQHQRRSGRVGSGGGGRSGSSSPQPAQPAAAFCLSPKRSAVSAAIPELAGWEGQTEYPTD